MSTEKLTDEAVAAWNAFKKEQPELALALSILPVTGQIAASTEYYAAMQRGDTGDAVLAATQFVPIVGKGLRSLPAMKRNAESASQLIGRLAEAKIGHNGETLREITDAAYKRASVNAGEAASGAVSAVTNFGEYLGQHISQANAAFNEGFKTK